MSYLTFVSGYLDFISIKTPYSATPKATRPIATDPNSFCNKLKASALLMSPPEFPIPVLKNKKAMMPATIPLAVKPIFPALVSKLWASGSMPACSMSSLYFPE